MLQGIKSLQKSRPTHHVQGTPSTKARFPPSVGTSTLFPVLTSFRSDLPLQWIWDHSLQRGLPSREGLDKQDPVPRRIPKRLHAQVWPSASSPHPSNNTGGPYKRRPPDLTGPTDTRSQTASTRSIPSQYTPSDGYINGSDQDGPANTFACQQLKCTGAKALSSLKS